MKEIEAMEDVTMRVFLSAYFKYQLHMGARLDDTAKLMQENIYHNQNDELGSLSLLNKLCWSKNMHEERESKKDFYLSRFLFFNIGAYTNKFFFFVYSLQANTHRCRRSSLLCYCRVGDMA